MDKESVLSWISELNDHEITEFVDALIKRQKILHPDWEAMYISFPLTDPEECRRILNYTWDMLSRG